MSNSNGAPAPPQGKSPSGKTVTNVFSTYKAQGNREDLAPMKKKRRGKIKKRPSP